MIEARSLKCSWLAELLFLRRVGRVGRVGLGRVGQGRARVGVGVGVV